MKEIAAARVEAANKKQQVEAANIEMTRKLQAAAALHAQRGRPSVTMEASNAGIAEKTREIRQAAGKQLHTAVLSALAAKRVRKLGPERATRKFGPERVKEGRRGRHQSRANEARGRDFSPGRPPVDIVDPTHNAIIPDIPDDR